MSYLVRNPKDGFSVDEADKIAVNMPIVSGKKVNKNNFSSNDLTESQHRGKYYYRGSPP